MCFYFWCYQIVLCKYSTIFSLLWVVLESACFFKSSPTAYIFHLVIGNLKDKKWCVCMCTCMYMYTYTHIHTLQFHYSWVSESFQVFIKAIFFFCQLSFFCVLMYWPKLWPFKHYISKYEPFYFDSSINSMYIAPWYPNLWYRKFSKMNLIFPSIYKIR